MSKYEANDKFEVSGLKDLEKLLNQKLKEVRIGFWGNKNSREDASSNATVGAVHEFGSKKHPRRSFLRDPINENFNKNLSQSRAFDKDVIAQSIKEKSLNKIMRIIASVAYSTVMEAFTTGNNGKWAPWKGKYKSKTGLILVNDQELRDAIRSEVV